MQLELDDLVNKGFTIEERNGRYVLRDLRDEAGDQQQQTEAQKAQQAQPLVQSEEPVLETRLRKRAAVDEGCYVSSFPSKKRKNKPSEEQKLKELKVALQEGMKDGSWIYEVEDDTTFDE